MRGTAVLNSIFRPTDTRSVVAEVGKKGMKDKSFLFAVTEKGMLLTGYEGLEIVNGVYFMP
ncbi:MAG: hypothetical protein NTV79_08585 [Candidatus Aureabacteria bacterium]|nr:hypothetical protein [Candidatus Auribacterota bacterium]